MDTATQAYIDHTMADPLTGSRRDQRVEIAQNIRHLAELHAAGVSDPRPAMREYAAAKAPVSAKKETGKSNDRSATGKKSSGKSVANIR